MLGDLVAGSAVHAPTLSRATTGATGRADISLEGPTALAPFPADVYSGHMANRWGNDQHGPGGDPSWLGGKDRGGDVPSADGGAGQGSGAATSDGSGAPSSDFGSDFASDASSSSDFSSDFSSDSDRRGPLPSAEDMAPRFGQSAGRSPGADDAGAEQSWRSGFEDSIANGNGRSGSSGKSPGAQIAGLLSSGVGIAIFAVIAWRVGFDQWWIVLFVAVPLINRVARMLGHGGKNDKQ